MKLLFMTDLHARGDSPRARLDNYPEAMRRKLSEVRELATAHNCAAVLYGGDLTHYPDVASSVVGALIRALRDWPCPIIGVSGNTHDVWGDNPATLPRTALGIVEAAGCIHLLRPGDRYMLDPEGTVQVTGQPYHADMDRRDPRLDYCVYREGDQAAPEGHEHRRIPWVRWAIHIVHGMLRTKPLPGGAHVTLVDQVAPHTAADITLTGHDHTGFGRINPTGRATFCNPGALMRLTAAKEEIARPVQVALITLTADQYDLQLLPLTTAAPGTEILDRSHIEEAESRAAALTQFLEGVRAGGDFEALDVPAVIRKVAENKGVPELVRLEALRRVEEAQQAVAAGAVVEEG